MASSCPPGGGPPDSKPPGSCPPGSGPPGKTSWPELVGKKGEVAVARIKSENPHMRDVFTIKEGTPVTLEIRFDRVRVWVNDSDIVTQVPTAG
ncbi:protease inhibitor HPI-like isoform X2 [Punica granatum]|uniref:Protease inhibitor HPI-like isoform X2 n=1 Tax=Punica granatum TaxID=22663 RepID=A0A6P8DDB5_PUNGR|nr:protease inhibitor HPI-like isoform X2 [Punica granatum]